MWRQILDKRPIGITIIGVLQVVGGLTGSFLGLATLVLLSEPISLFIGSVVYLISLALLIVSLFYLVVGWGFLSAQGWAWVVGILLNILGVVLAIAAVASGSTVSGISGLIVNLIILSYLSKRSVRVYFGQALPLTGEKAQAPSYAKPSETSASRVICPRCGSEIMKGAKRCGVCGSPL